MLLESCFYASKNWIFFCHRSLTVLFLFWITKRVSFILVELQWFLSFFYSQSVFFFFYQPFSNCSSFTIDTIFWFFCSINFLNLADSELITTFNSRYPLVFLSFESLDLHFEVISRPPVLQLLSTMGEWNVLMFHFFSHSDNSKTFLCFTYVVDCTPCNVFFSSCGHRPET